MAAPDPGFADFIRRLRAGDEGAAAELVRRYEPHIRRIVRLHLMDSMGTRLYSGVCFSGIESRPFFFFFCPEPAP
jgi:hypothetical protein